MLTAAAIFHVWLNQLRYAHSQYRLEAYVQKHFQSAWWTLFRYD